MSLTGAVTLSAGASPAVICVDSNSSSITQFGEGDLNGILISSSKTGTSAAAQQSARKLAIVKALTIQRGLTPWNPFSSSEPNGFPGCSITCFNR